MYAVATEALCSRLDPGGCAPAAQNFCHKYQRDNEAVADFIRRLECTYQLPYGHDKITTETGATLLHSQLQEGLWYKILQTLTVSAAQTYYAELCLAAQNKERRQIELNKREQYQQDSSTSASSTSGPSTRSSDYTLRRVATNLAAPPTPVTTTNVIQDNPPATTVTSAITAVTHVAALTTLLGGVRKGNTRAEVVVELVRGYLPALRLCRLMTSR